MKRFAFAVLACITAGLMAEPSDAHAGWYGARTVSFRVWTAAPVTPNVILVPAAPVPIPAATDTCSGGVGGLGALDVGYAGYGGGFGFNSVGYGFNGAFTRRDVFYGHSGFNGGFGGRVAGGGGQAPIDLKVGPVRLSVGRRR